jgi:hypothetical protein
VLLPPFVIAIVLIAGLVALVPGRRLHLAGASIEVIATWVAASWLVGIVVFLAPGLARVTIPLLIVLVLIPFALPGLLGRLFPRRGPSRPPMKNVTPPQEHPNPPQ